MNTNSLPPTSAASIPAADIQYSHARAGKAEEEVVVVLHTGALVAFGEIACMSLVVSNRAFVHGASPLF